MDDLLASGHFRHLEAVEITLRLDIEPSTVCDESDIRDAVNTRLPALCTRNILKVEVEFERAA